MLRRSVRYLPMEARFSLAGLVLSFLVGCGDAASSSNDGAGGSGGQSGSSAASGGSGGTSAAGASSAGTSAGGSNGGTGGSVTGGGTTGTSSPECAPLPELPDDAIMVTPDQADDLPSIARDAPGGATIALAAGTYTMTGADEASRRIQIVNPGVTLRSASGDRESVIIDGKYLTSEIVTISASDVTLAAITITRASAHPVHVTGAPTANVTGVRLVDLHIVDGGEQFVKVNTSGADPNTYVDDGVLECSLLELTDEGRPHVNPVNGGCYTGGIDGHQARGWIVRNNVFKDIYCHTGLAEHAVHFWTASRDTLVERNTIVDCARAVGFGLGDGGGSSPERTYADDPYPGVGYVGHYDGIIRNNVISISDDNAEFDTGIELEQARGTRVYHNTIVHPATAFASISHRWPNTLVTISNNLVESIKGRDGSQSDGSNNLENATDDLFVDRAGHDLHLVSTAAIAIDQGLVVDEAGDDIDGAAHDVAAPDIGADEFGAP